MRKAVFSILATLLMAFGFVAAAIAQGSNIVVNDEKCADLTSRFTTYEIENTSQCEAP
jgi:hypothetical protein